MRAAVFLAVVFLTVFASAERQDVIVFDDFSNSQSTSASPGGFGSASVTYSECTGLLGCFRGMTLQVSKGVEDAMYTLEVSQSEQQLQFAAPVGTADSGENQVLYYPGGSSGTQFDITSSNQATGMRISYSGGGHDLEIFVRGDSSCQHLETVTLPEGERLTVDIEYKDFTTCDLAQTSEIEIRSTLADTKLHKFTAINGEPTCAPGTFRNVDDVCRSCGGGCTECATADTCTTCETEGYFKNADNVCRRCPAGCRSCTSETVCNDDGCRTGFGLKADKSCAACPAGCSVCTEESGTFVCMMCDTGRFLTVGDKLCKLSCPAGQYESFGYGQYRKKLDYQSGGGMCVSCPDGCELCTEGRGKSVSVTPVGYDKLKEPITSSGQPVCYACQKMSDDTPTFSQDGDCKTECLRATYEDMDSFTCLACPHACTECSSKDECSECATNFVLSSDSKRCIQSCPSGETENSDGKCVACAGDCATCSGVLDTECLSCTSASGKYYNPETQTCVISTDCPSDTYPKETGATNEEFRICQACSLRCTAGCTGPSRSDCAVPAQQGE